MKARHLVVVFWSCVAASLTAQTLPPGYSLEPVAQNLALAAALAFTPDGRLLVTERVSGRIVQVTGAGAPRTYASVPVQGGAGSEVGLLGIAVDPSFPSSGHVYVHHVRGSSFEVTLTRFTETGGLGGAAVEVGAPIPVPIGHVGGVLCFGADGHLYLARGDGFVPAAAQQLGSWHGKILRYAVPSGTAPADNPFANAAGAEALVWSYGHRNVFGLCVHPPTGAMLCTENGNFLSDELNTVRRGANYGWPVYEGREPVPDPATEDPLDAFSPEPSLTGAGFWTAEFAPPAERDLWFVGSFNRGEVFAARVDPTGASILARSTFATLTGPVIGVSEGPDGYLYLLHADTRQQGGDRVSRLVHTSLPSPSLHLSAPSNRALGGSMTLGVVGDAGALAFTWLSATRASQPLVTPFGELWVSPDLQLPATPVASDRRGYVVLSLPDLPNLRGVRVHAQGATLQGTTLRLTNPSALVLR